MGVTDNNLLGGATIKSRNTEDTGLVAVRRIRNIRGQVMLEFRFPNADASKCRKCRRTIGRTEPVYRVPREDRTRVWCEDCAQDLRTNLYEWARVKCEGCGRTVVFRTDRRRRRHVFCSMVCEWTFYNRQRSERAAKAREKVCEVCGQSFTATRRDAKTCSSACKQKAYRQRAKCDKA